MRTFSCFLVAAVVTGCSGGGSSNDNPPAGENLALVLVTTGVTLPASTPSANRTTLVTSAAQLTQLSAGRFAIPASLANFDYATGTVVYTEAAGDMDPASVQRLVQIHREMGMDSVTSETCSSINPVAGLHRAFALYTTPNLLNPAPGSANAFAFFPCFTVSRLPATFIAGGLAPIDGFAPRPPLVIRDQVAWDGTKARLPAGSIPPQYATPDFSQVVLVYVETLGDSDPNLYVRLMGAYSNSDGSHDVVAELCGAVILPPQTYNHFAVYSVPRFTGDARLAKVAVTPPDCLTAR